MSFPFPLFNCKIEYMHTMDSFVPYTRVMDFDQDCLFVPDGDPQFQYVTRARGHHDASNGLGRTPLHPRTHNQQLRPASRSTKASSVKQSTLSFTPISSSDFKEQIKNEPTVPARPAKRARQPTPPPDPRSYRFAFGEHEGARPCEVP
jgi:hypothetical protein